MEWISVKDRLPITEKQLKNKFYDDAGIIYYDGDRVGFCYYSSGLVPEFWGKFEQENVTHWMPLPSPPKD